MCTLRQAGNKDGILRKSILEYTETETENRQRQINAIRQWYRQKAFGTAAFLGYRRYPIITNYRLKPENNHLGHRVATGGTDMLIFKDSFPATEDRQLD